MLALNEQLYFSLPVLAVVNIMPSDVISTELSRMQPRGLLCHLRELNQMMTLPFRQYDELRSKQWGEVFPLPISASYLGRGIAAFWLRFALTLLGCVISIAIDFFNDHVPLGLDRDVHKAGWWVNNQAFQEFLILLPPLASRQLFALCKCFLLWSHLGESIISVTARDSLSIAAWTALLGPIWCRLILQITQENFLPTGQSCLCSPVQYVEPIHSDPFESSQEQ